MGASEQITGILPAVVAGGVALKFTEGFLSKPRGWKEQARKRARKDKVIPRLNTDLGRSDI